MSRRIIKDHMEQIKTANVQNGIPTRRSRLLKVGVFVIELISLNENRKVLTVTATKSIKHIMCLLEQTMR